MTVSLTISGSTFRVQFALLAMLAIAWYHQGYREREKGLCPRSQQG